jgi:enoyl-CoA hydratase/carnithine racemase
MKTVRFERQGAIGRIVLANPPRNLLDRQFSECLRRAVHDASESDIHVLVVQTEGPNFSFGSDLREWIDKCSGAQSCTAPRAIKDGFRRTFIETGAAFRALSLSLETFKRPVGVAHS